MELTVLDGETLKILLSSEESLKYGLNAALWDPTDPLHVSACPDQDTDLPPGGRLVLRSLLEEAGRRAGFDLVNRRILVRIYQAALGGHEIYVSAADNLPDLRPEEEPDTVCKTDSPQNALRLKLALGRLGFRGSTETYLDAEGNGCFLRVRGKYPPILGEFGNVLSASGEKIAPWLKEHCRRLREEDGLTEAKE